MSAIDTRMERPRAIEIAKAFVAEIEACCDQLIVAGSLRRRLGRIGDVEIVAVPKIGRVAVTSTDLFGVNVQHRDVDLLDAKLNELLAQGRLQKRHKADGSLAGWGPRSKYLTFDGARVDVFSAVNDWRDEPPPKAEPDRFGWLLLIRTGPGKFSNQMVVDRGKKTKDRRPGLKPEHLVSEGGWLRYRASREPIATPTEESVFELFGLPYREPRERV